MTYGPTSAAGGDAVVLMAICSLGSMSLAGGAANGLSCPGNVSSGDVTSTWCKCLLTELAVAPSEAVLGVCAVGPTL